MNSLNDIPLSHTNDSQASFDAGDKIKGKVIKEEINLLVNNLRNHPKVTLRELAYAITHEEDSKIESSKEVELYYKFQKRASIAENFGFIKRTGERFCARSHFKATTWEVTNQYKPKKEQGELFDR